MWAAVGCFVNERWSRVHYGVCVCVCVSTVGLWMHCNHEPKVFINAGPGAILGLFVQVDAHVNS